MGEYSSAEISISGQAAQVRPRYSAAPMTQPHACGKPPAAGLNGKTHKTAAAGLSDWTSEERRLIDTHTDNVLQETTDILGEQAALTIETLRFNVLKAGTNVFANAVQTAYAPKQNNRLLIGARTGGDGIGGASILASDTFAEGGPTKRPAVQVGDPFAEKVLIECCLELFAGDCVEGIQDLGAAGISCATSELASNGDGGMHITLDNVLLRDPTLTAEEILMSESQERMMAVVRPEKLDAFLAVTTKWDVEASVLGEVTDSGRLIIEWKGQTIVDVDPRTVAIDGPVYNRPMEYPAWLDALQADSPAKFARATDGDELKKQFLAILGSPNEADTDWITNQYDYYVMGNTALHTPDGAGMIRIDEESGLGVALATDANGRYCQLDPYVGAQLALVESYRNVASSGATPLAVSDCLNFGSPENPEVMWQFARAVEGLADGCLELGIPVTGGNVSFYNQTGDVPIHPTPVVAVMGSIDNVARRLPSGWQDEGENLYLLGVTADELGGSAWAGAVHDHLGGVPPRVDFAAEKNLAGLLGAAAHEGIVTSAVDLGTGGFLRAVADGVLRFGVGARVWIDEIVSRDGVDATAALFSETQARALVSVAREDDVKFRGLCDGRGVPVLRVGVTDKRSGELEVQGLFSVDIDSLRSTHRGTLPAHFGPVVGG